MLALTVVALLVAPLAATAASGLPPTVTMVPETAGPGADVEISGLDFPANQTIDLQLTTTAGPVHLGTANTVDGGYFRQSVTLPVDAPAGFWELRATAPDGSVAVHLFEATDAAAITEAAEAASLAAQTSGGGNSIGDIAVMLVFALLIAGIGGAIYYVYYQSKMGDTQPGMSMGADPIWSGSAGQEAPESTATDEPAWRTAAAAAPDAQQAPSPTSR